MLFPASLLGAISPRFYLWCEPCDALRLAALGFHWQSLAIFLNNLVSYFAARQRRSVYVGVADGESMMIIKNKSRI